MRGYVDKNLEFKWSKSKNFSAGWGTCPQNPLPAYGPVLTREGLKLLTRVSQADPDRCCQEIQSHTGDSQSRDSEGH